MTRIPSPAERLVKQRNGAILYGLACLAILVGCGGGGTEATPKAVASAMASAGAVTPTASPTASPTPIPLTATPSSVAFGGVNKSQQITVTEKGFSGTFTAVSNDTTIVTVSPPSVVVSTTTAPASTGVFSATSIGIGTNNSGTTTITISDGTLTFSVPVTVSVTSGNITYYPGVLVRLNG